MEKRKESRIAVNNLNADVSDGSGFFHGLVSNVSLSGVCLFDLPEHLHINSEKLTVVLSEKQEHYRMDVSLRWHLSEGNKKTIGAKIINAPWTWMEFMARLEPTSAGN